MIVAPWRTEWRSTSFLVSLLAWVVALFVPTSISFAVVTSATQHGLNHDSLNSLISSTDLIQGKMELDVDVYVNPSDSFGISALPGWHPANSNPADQLAAFTDGAGILASGLTGLLNDNNVPDPSGRPAKIVEYPFDSPVDIGRINIFTGNRNNADSRIFSSTYIEYSTDNAFSFQPLGYFQSDPSGTINDESNPASTFSPPQKSTLLSVFDNSSAMLLSGVTNIIFNLYSAGSDIDPVSPLRGIHGDPFDGTSLITGIDDGIRSAFVSPLVFEIDVLAPQAGVVGDYNNNQVVDAADYTVWRDSVGGASLLNRDPNNAGAIGQADYDSWKTRFGNITGSGAGGAAVVPEPGMWVMLVPLLAALFRVRAREFVRR